MYFSFTTQVNVADNEDEIPALVDSVSTKLRGAVVAFSPFLVRTSVVGTIYHYDDQSSHDDTTGNTQ